MNIKNLYLQRGTTYYAQSGITPPGTNFLTVWEQALTELTGFPAIKSCCFKGTQPTNGQTLVYNSTTKTFEFGSGGSGTFNTLSGEATSTATGGATTLVNSAVIGKVLTGYVSGVGTVAATDTILQGFNKLNGNAVALTTNVTSLITLSGVAANAINLGTFTGTTIADNVVVKVALQSLETAVELKATDNLVLHLAGAETITGIKTFTAQPVGITGASIVNTAAGNIAATTVQAAINELDNEKQAKIAFYEEGTIVGTLGQYSKVNFIGGTVTAAQDGTDSTQLNVTVTSSGGGSTSKYLANTTGAVISSAGSTSRIKGTSAISVTKTSGSIYTFAIPASGYLENADLFIPATEAPGSNLSLVFNYTSNTVTNQGLSTADAPSCKGFFTAGVPVDVYNFSSTASSSVLRKQITAVGSGNITVVLDLGTAGLSGGDIVIKVNF